MPSRRKNSGVRVAVAAIVALFAHAAAIALFAAFAGDLTGPLRASSPRVTSAAPASNSVEDDRPMEIETLVDQLDRPEEKSAEEKRREEEAKKEEEDKNPHGQVVDIAKPA